MDIKRITKDTVLPPGRASQKTEEHPFWLMDNTFGDRKTAESIFLFGRGALVEVDQDGRILQGFKEYE